jgi:hypothetical protein
MGCVLEVAWIMKTRLAVLVGLLSWLGVQDAREVSTQPTIVWSQDTRGLLDALGTVYTSSVNSKGGGFFQGSGNPGFVIHIRNWDPTQSVRSLAGIVGFSPNSPIRVLSAAAQKLSADGSEASPKPTDLVTVDERGVIHMASGLLRPAETLVLEVRLSATPSGPYGFAFNAEY